jgi:excisionase family DNA binding protein
MSDNETADVLWGASEIANFIGVTRRRCFFLLQAGHIPARKVGGGWCARKSSLLAYLAGDKGEAA